MKNFLVFEGSWQRIAPQVPYRDRFQPVLFHKDLSLSLNGEPVDSVPIHAAWLNFDFGFDRLPAFVDILMSSDALAFVQTAAAGLDSRLFKTLASKPIQLCNSDAQAPAIAEFVLASILNRLHRFDLRAARQRQHEWENHPFRELGGCRCLLVGHGYIGSRIAERLASFGTHLTVIRRSVEELPHVDRLGTLTDLPELLPDADIVILATALNDQTRDLFDADMFARLKPGAILVNIGRGALIDESAMLDVLNEGRLDYAVLDVFRKEPLPDDHPFWDHERVLVTAHTASAGSDRSGRGDQLMIENLENYLTGQPLRNLVELGSIR